MKLRVVLVGVLGAWIAGTLFMWMGAIQNFAVVDAILAAERPELAELGDLRPALRYQASEVNRRFFEGWGWVQIGLGAVAAGLAWRGGARRWIFGLCFACWGIALALQLYVVPETIATGRRIDFATLPAVENRFWTLHHAYTGLDMAKFLGLLGVACALILPTPRKNVS